MHCRALCHDNLDLLGNFGGQRAEGRAGQCVAEQGRALDPARSKEILLHTARQRASQDEIGRVLLGVFVALETIVPSGSELCLSYCLLAHNS